MKSPKSSAAEGTAPGQIFWARTVRHETLEGERRRAVLELRFYPGDSGSAIRKVRRVLEGLRDAGSFPPTLAFTGTGHQIRIRIAGLPVDATHPNADRFAGDALRDAIQATGKMLGMSDRSHDSDIVGYLAHLPAIKAMAQFTYRDPQARPMWR